MKSSFPQRRPLLFVVLLLLVILVTFILAGAITIATQVSTHWQLLSLERVCLR